MGERVCMKDVEKYVINMDSRVDRLTMCYDYFKQHKLTVKRFSAIVVSEYNSNLLLGEIGCKLSHMKLVEHAKNSNLSEIMIFEDDVVLFPNFRIVYDNIVKNLPPKYHFVQFGANIQDRIEQYSPMLSRCFGMYAAHCYIVSSSVYDMILSCTDDVPIDVIYRNIHRQGNSYISNIPVCTQSKGYSDIQNSFVDYTGLLK